MKKAVPHKRLGDLFVFKNGRAFKKDEWTTTGLPIIRIQNLNSKDAPFNYFAGEHSRDILVEQGDLLFSWSGTVGSSFGSHLWDREPGVLNQHIFKIGYREDIDKRYAFYALRHITTAIEESVNGAVGLVHITKEKLHEFTLPVPPLAEQQRIVGMLDEAFAGLAIAQANAEKNLQNARALFESHLQSVFTQRGKGWVEDRLQSLATKIGSGATPRGGEESYKTEGVSLIRSLNVHDMGFRYQKLAFLDDVQADGLSNVVVQKRDVLLNITGASVARCCLAPEDVLPARVNQHVSIIRPIADKLSPEFLHYLLISRPYKTLLLQTGEGGSTRQAITKAQIQELKIAYPKTLAEQQEVVAKLDALATRTQRLARLYEQKQAALTALKKSLLHRAFTGELTHDLRESKIIQFPVAVPNITTTDLHAGILAMAYRIHEQHGKQAEFGHVKGEKISHLIESLVGIDLGRMPVKDAAGPNDFPHLQKVEHRAKKAGYFLFQRAGGAYRVTKYRKFDELLARTESVLGERRAEVDRLLDLMWPMTAQQAEVFATVFAAWNNLLLDGEPISDERIVQEARENWHPDKLKIPREKFFAAITWIKEKGICPEGKGKKVLNKAVKKRR